MPINKYHEAINLAIHVLKEDVKRVQAMDDNAITSKDRHIAVRWEAVARLGEIQDLMFPAISQLKQLLSELDLEEK